MKKLYLSIVVVGMGAALHAGKVADQISSVQNTVDAVLNVADGAIGITSQETQKKYHETYKPRLRTIADTVKGSANVAANIEDFIAVKLDEVKRKGSELQAAMNCLNNPSAAGCTCTNKNICLVRVLKTFKELLMPLLETLIAKGALEGGKKVYKDGAVYNLVSMPVIPTQTRESLQLTIATYVDKLMAAIAFVDLLSLVLEAITILCMKE